MPHIIIITAIYHSTASMNGTQPQPTIKHLYGNVFIRKVIFFVVTNTSLAEIAKVFRI